MAKNLRTPTEHELTQFSKWRSIALFHMPYMASILFSLRLVSADGLGTLAVDKNMRLYIDFPAVEADYTDDENGQNLLHEASHIFADHASVRDEIGVTADQAMTFNVAADAAINDDLVAGGLDSFATSGIMPSQFGEPDHQSAQYYFRSLMSRIEDQKPEEAEGGDDTDDADSDSGTSGSGQPGDSSNGEGEQSDGDRDDEAGQPKFVGCGSVSGGQPAPCELGEDDDMDGSAKPATKAERERIQAVTAKDVEQYVANNGIGSVPGTLVEAARAVFAQKAVPWQKELGMLVRRSTRRTSGEGVTDHRKRDRRNHRLTIMNTATGTSRRIILPGQSTQTPSIHVIRDTSYSMSDDELFAAGREIAAISKSLRIKNDDLRVSDCDVGLGVEFGYSSLASLDQIHGRGGTDMEEALVELFDRYDKSNRPLPSAVITLTDGFTPWPDEPIVKGVPVIACIIDSAVGTAIGMTPDTPPAWIHSINVVSETAHRTTA
ncbi:VWA-like domain-containing protein [Brevibacterium antiquum]|uniref:vWA domain-containing protein n=1 Tax=Brevibacterium antiquum TaxID=234835 RepID=UPI0018DF509D|nr:VWA-like domain-containing protein [Brevibacterium antiquum]